MNIILIGRSNFLYATANLLLDKGHKIVGIVTAKASREDKINEEDFFRLSRDLNIPCFLSSKLDNENGLRFLQSCWPFEIGVSVNYVSIIPENIIQLFPLGVLNAHGGDLPQYRGNACQAWAILNGEKKIGLCIHKMNGGTLDSGNIIAREYFQLNINHRIGQVHAWMQSEIPKLFLNAIDNLGQNKDYCLEKQSSDKKDILRCYPRVPSDSAIFWEDKNEQILKLINASSEPYAGAFCQYNREAMVIWRAEIYFDEEQYCAVSGQVSKIILGKGVVVITGHGKILLTEVEYRGLRCNAADIIKSIRTRLLDGNKT